MSCGPLLQFTGYSRSDGNWHGSALLVCGEGSIGTPELIIDDFQECSVLPGEKLDVLHGSSFWRFDLGFVLTRHQREVTYSFRVRELQGLAQSLQTWSFWLPSNTDAWHWGFYTGSGLHPDADRANWGPALLKSLPLWGDVLADHARRPLHVMVGGGDQVVADGLLLEGHDLQEQRPCLRAWLLTPSSEERLAAPFSRAMAMEVEQYYLNLYLHHFRELGIVEAVSSIPQVMLWGQRDVLEGHGTFPASLQHMPVLEGIYSVARRLYLLFQHHAMEQHVQARKRQGDLFGPGQSLSFLRHVGQTTALLGIDLVSDRSPESLCSPEAVTDAMQQVLTCLGQEVRHLLVIASVPLVSPHLPERPASLSNGSTSQEDQSTQCGPFYGRLTDQLLQSFGAPAQSHKLLEWPKASERENLLEHLQELSRLRDVKVTLLSCGPGCTAVARLSQSSRGQGLDKDTPGMLQLICSGLADQPASQQLLRSLTTPDLDIMPGCRAKLQAIFKVSERLGENSGEDHDEDGRLAGTREILVPPVRSRGRQSELQAC